MEKYYYKSGRLAKTVEVIANGIQKETMYDVHGGVIWQGSVVCNKRHGKYKIANTNMYFWYGESIEQEEYQEKVLIEGLAGLYE
jgi:hypothetical protein